MSNLAGEGVSLGASYRHVLSKRFELTGSTSFIFFHSKHYPAYTPVGIPVSLDYKVNMLPLLVGASFHPFNGRFTKKLFLSGKVGGQWIFYKSDDLEVQQSTYYTSKELDFSYSYEVGIDLTVFQLLFASTFVVSRNDNLVNKINYFNITANIRVWKGFARSSK